MVNKSHLNKVLGLFVLILLLLVSSGRFAFAQDRGGEEIIHLDPNGSNDPQAPVPGGPGFIMIHSSAFAPYDQTVLFTNLLSLKTSAGSPFWNYSAPVNLPHGATVTQLTYYFSDTDTIHHSSINLNRYPVPGSTYYTMANLTSPESPEAAWTEVHTNTISTPLIDNQANVYYLDLSLPPATQPGKYLYACAVRIDYSYPTYVPAVQR